MIPLISSSLMPHFKFNLVAFTTIKLVIIMKRERDTITRYLTLTLDRN
jgi:hypothetical protein